MSVYRKGACKLDGIEQFPLLSFSESLPCTGANLSQTLLWGAKGWLQTFSMLSSKLDEIPPWNKMAGDKTRRTSGSCAFHYSAAVVTQHKAAFVFYLGCHVIAVLKMCFGKQLKEMDLNFLHCNYEERHFRWLIQPLKYWVVCDFINGNNPEMAFTIFCCASWNTAGDEVALSVQWKEWLSLWAGQG